MILADAAVILAPVSTGAMLVIAGPKVSTIDIGA